MQQHLLTASSSSCAYSKAAAPSIHSVKVGLLCLHRASAKRHERLMLFPLTLCAKLPSRRFLWPSMSALWLRLSETMTATQMLLQASCSLISPC